MIERLLIGFNRWKAWQRRTADRRVFTALMIVGGCTVVVKLVAFVKDAIVAYQFGTGDAMDAFLIALVLPQFAVTLIGASLNTALIPTYIQVREREGREAANRLMSSVMSIASLFLLGVSLLLALSASHVLPLLASGFSPNKLRLAESLYLPLLCTLLLYGVGTIWGAVLNAVNRFALVATVPLVTSLVTIGSVLALTNSYGVHALAFGAVGGALIETGLIGWWLHREDVSIVPQWSGMSPAIREVLGQYVPMVAGAFLMGGATVVSQSMAAMLDPGSVSVLTYAGKMTNLLIGIGATAVSTAFLPHFSRLTAAEDWQGVRRTLSTYSQFIFLLTIPAVALLSYFSEGIIALFFQRGAFTGADTRIVGHVQVMYLLQVPVYVVGMLFVRLVSALRANQLMMWGNVVNLLLCIVLTYALVHVLGVAGVALATSLIYFFNTSFLYVMSMRTLRRMQSLSGSQEKTFSSFQ
jgi:putative peptidoglycan lipid II flippase